MTPICPPHYSCTFSPKNPPQTGPWWEHAAGIAVAIVAIVAATIVLCTMAYYLWDGLKDKRSRAQNERERQRNQAHELALAEQRTMALDAAKGDPEMLKVARDLGMVG